MPSNPETHTPAYSPSSNLVKRFHRTLNQILSVYMEIYEKSWQHYIDTAAFAYNTKINEATLMTTFEAFIGRPAKLPINLIMPTPEKRYKNEAEYIQDTMLRFEQVYKYIHDQTEARF